MLARYSLIHLTPEQLPAALGEFRRVLAPGGYLFVAGMAGRARSPPTTTRSPRRTGGPWTGYSTNWPPPASPRACACFATRRPTNGPSPGGDRPGRSTARSRPGRRVAPEPGRPPGRGHCVAGTPRLGAGMARGRAREGGLGRADRAAGLPIGKSPTCGGPGRPGAAFVADRSASAVPGPPGAWPGSLGGAVPQAWVRHRAASAAAGPAHREGTERVAMG
ncbi:hypothetical protein ACFQZC_34310 [Streptacidiphilus monticola]